MTTPQINFQKEMAEDLVVHKPFRKQEMIITTVDRLRLCLRDSRRITASLTAWIAPFSCLLTLIATLVSADFKEALTLQKEQWHVLFILATGAMGCWFVFTVVSAIRAAVQAIRSRCLDPDEAVIKALRVHGQEIAEVSPEAERIIEATQERPKTRRSKASEKPTANEIAAEESSGSGDKI